MSLPKILVAQDVITVEGQEIKIRGLTRGEAMCFQKMIADGCAIRDLELAVLSAGTDTPPEETATWYDETPQHAVEPIIAAIKELSKIDEGAQKSS